MLHAPGLSLGLRRITAALPLFSASPTRHFVVRDFPRSRFPAALAPDSSS
jgi:hypothetical protein